jgi:Cdc6-like AAA superfamily ATPase
MKSSTENAPNPAPGPAVRPLPKKALERIHLGQSFAEYDTSLESPSVYVHTPALQAASDPTNPHCFFVGRRGTGKTATTKFLMRNSQRVTLIRPEIFSPSSLQIPIADFEQANQKPFRSLLAAFKRSLQDEVLFQVDVPSNRLERGTQIVLQREREIYGGMDFDLRVLHFIKGFTQPLADSDDLKWLEELKVTKTLSKAMSALVLERNAPYIVLLDAIDDFWDGSQQAVLYLTALMHAAVEVNSHVSGVRVLIFLRENIFERVRLVDWTEAQLIEMIERRTNAPLPAKLPLGGATWEALFEDGAEARRMVLEFCQHRPRDVLTYCSLALDTAQAHKHDQILLEDLHDARRRFSDSRLKDLSDEYQENYPQIAVVLESFYGLGQRYTTGGMQDFLDRLLQDTQAITHCGKWLFEYGTVERFVRLLYDIGFVGLRESRKGNTGLKARFRSLGPRDTTPPPISESTEIALHPSYHPALDLQDVLVGSLDQNQEIRRTGMILDLPGALSLDDYQEYVRVLHEQIKTVGIGREDAAAFESIVGDTIEACLFRSLTNVKPQERDVDGTIRRDWVASNRAQFGFWEMMRQRYNATQVIFECKNYEDLKSSDFQQAAYYMSGAAGRLVIIVFRGDTQKKHYYEHIRRISSDTGGLVLLLNDKDLAVFARQALKGKVKDDHIQDRYDMTVRLIS